jgi:hypothetical protein
MQGEETRAGRMSEGEGVERDGGERDNTTFAVAEWHVSDGVPYSRFFFHSFLFSSSTNHSGKHKIVITLILPWEREFGV